MNITEPNGLQNVFVNCNIFSKPNKNTFINIIYLDNCIHMVFYFSNIKSTKDIDTLSFKVCDWREKILSPGTTGMQLVSDLMGNTTNIG